MKFDEGLLYVKEGLGYKAGRFVVTDAPDAPKNAASLVVGAPNVVKIKGGHMIVLGLSRLNLEGLRDQCQRLIDQHQKEDARLAASTVLGKPRAND